jgi:hypothetical protein
MIDEDDDSKSSDSDFGISKINVCEEEKTADFYAD